MSLDTLPSTAIRRLVSNSKNTADERSLRLTCCHLESLINCRRDREILDLHRTKLLQKVFEDDPKVQQELESIIQPLRPGTLLADKGLTACVVCLRFKPSSSEFPLESLKFD